MGLLLWGTISLDKSLAGNIEWPKVVPDFPRADGSLCQSPLFSFKKNSPRIGERQPAVRRLENGGMATILWLETLHWCFAGARVEICVFLFSFQTCSCSLLHEPQLLLRYLRQPMISALLILRHEFSLWRFVHVSDSTLFGSRSSHLSVYFAFPSSWFLFHDFYSMTAAAQEGVFSTRQGSKGVYQYSRTRADNSTSLSRPLTCSSKTSLCVIQKWNACHFWQYLASAFCSQHHAEHASATCRHLSGTHVRIWSKGKMWMWSILHPSSDRSDNRNKGRNVVDSLECQASLA